MPGYLPQGFQETGFRQHQPHVAGNRFNNDGCNFTTLPFKGANYSFGIIVGNADGFFCHLR